MVLITNLSSTNGRLLPFLLIPFPFAGPFTYIIEKALDFLHLKQALGVVLEHDSTIPSFHLIWEAFIVVVPSSAKEYVFVSFVSSKYGFSEKFCQIFKIKQVNTSEPMWKL
jgi:hypothetical protein